MAIRALTVLALALLIPLMPGPATADVIYTYSVEGSYGPGGLHAPTGPLAPTAFPGTLSGTLTVNATTHLVTAANITASTIPNAFNVVVLNTAQNPNKWIVTLDNVSVHTTFRLQMDSATTLFAGLTTAIDPISGFDGFGYFPGTDGSPFSGTLTIAAVPEASTWAMLLIGFAGVGVAACRRKSKPALTPWRQ
jgi:hypothetical protein